LLQKTRRTVPIPNRNQPAPFALGLVFLEAVVGLLVLLGLWTRESLMVGSATIAALIFGTALRSDWNPLAIQLL